MLSLERDSDYDARSEATVGNSVKDEAEFPILLWRWAGLVQPRP